MPTIWSDDKKCVWANVKYKLQIKFASARVLNLFRTVSQMYWGFWFWSSSSYLYILYDIIWFAHVWSWGCCSLFSISWTIYSMWTGAGTRRLGGFTYCRCEPYWGIAFGLQITAGNHSKCTLILYYINQIELEAIGAAAWLAAGGLWLNAKETRGDSSGREWPGLISALRYNLCALICNSITQAQAPAPVGGAAVATVATGSHRSLCRVQLC